MKIQTHPSPSFGPRRHGLGPDMVVLHHTAMLTCKAAVERLCDAKSEVSAHYVIGENGETFQLVDEGQRAWHAGAGAWGPVSDLNSHSVGIELANAGPLVGFPPFPEPQMSALETLLAGILTRHKIPPQNVIAHSDMAPSRKFDPGAKFDWRRLAQGGLSIWPTGGGAKGGDFWQNAQRFGYHCEGQHQAALSAFRLRFRPGVAGPPDDQDRAIMQELADRYPVDLHPTNT